MLETIQSSHGQAPKFGFTNNRKTLKIPVFGGPRVYLVVFVFVAMTSQETLVLFDLYESHFQYIWENLNLVFLIEKITN